MDKRKTENVDEFVLALKIELFRNLSKLAVILELNKEFEVFLKRWDVVGEEELLEIQKLPNDKKMFRLLAIIMWEPSDARVLGFGKGLIETSQGQRLETVSKCQAFISHLDITETSRLQIEESKEELWEENRMLHRSRVETFSLPFTHESEGALQKPGSDVIITVPQGAVPKGEKYIINCSIRTDLWTLSKHLPADHYIVGPVVELTTLGKAACFDVPVKVKIPHCVAPSEVSMIKVFHGTDDRFKEIQKKDCIQCDKQDKFLVIYTSKFCTFALIGGGTLTVERALITVHAPVTWDEKVRSLLELRLMLHTQCAILPDFKDKRDEICDKGMKEINSVTLRLPGDHQNTLPEISLELEILLNDWKLVRPKEKVVIPGSDVFKEMPQGYSSQHMTNFVLQKKTSRHDLEVMIHFVFKYEKRPILDSIVVNWPTDKKHSTKTSLNVQETEATTTRSTRSMVKGKQTFPHTCSSESLSKRQKVEEGSKSTKNEEYDVNLLEVSQTTSRALEYPGEEGPNAQDFDEATTTQLTQSMAKRQWTTAPTRSSERLSKRRKVEEGPNTKDFKGNTNQERPGEDKPLWDSSHPDGQVFIRGSDLGHKLTKAAPDLKDIVHTADLWAHLQRYRVMGSADVERCKKAGHAEADQVESIIDFLKKSQAWKVHAFFRNLAKTGQAGVIDVVLGPNGQTPYTRNLKD